MCGLLDKEIRSREPNLRTLSVAPALSAWLPVQA